MTGSTVAKSGPAGGNRTESGYQNGMQSFCDLETDKMSAARLGGSAPAHAPAPYRESWLDRLARALAPMPVDHMPIVPRECVPPACCTTADCC